MMPQYKSFSRENCSNRTAVLNERMWHFRWSKHTPTHRTYFQGSRPPLPGPTLLRVCHIWLELTYVWRRLVAHRSSGCWRVESVERDIDELAVCRHISGKPSHLGPPGLSVVRTSHSSTVLDSPHQETHPSGRLWSCSLCSLRKRNNTVILTNAI